MHNLSVSVASYSLKPMSSICMYVGPFDVILFVILSLTGLGQLVLHFFEGQLTQKSRVWPYQ